MSKTPTARDLFEARNLEVRPSTIEGAGDGVFAVRDLINVGDVLGYFNGVRYLSDFIIWARRAHNKTVVASQGASTDSRFMEEKLWLELSDGDENWHEHWLGHGRRLEGLGFGIAHAQRAQLCAKRARMHLFAVYGG